MRALIVPITALLVLAAGFTALGRWQVERAAENRDALEHYQDAAARPAVSLAELRDDPAAALHRRVALRGRFLPGPHILLDNIVREGRPGYEVLTPFAPVDTGPYVLVNRGWIAATADRSRLPDVELIGSPEHVEGRVATLPRAAIDLGGEVVARDLDRVVLSYPTAADIAALLEHPVMPYQVQLDANAPDGFQRDWQPDSDRPSRNLGYAVQWFAFAAVAAVGAVVVAARHLRRSSQSLVQ